MRETPGTLLGFSGYPWLVIAAGWGFDVYDALLFNFLAAELFPAAVRATGAGFCYNIGRVFAAAGPLIVGTITAAAGGSRRSLTGILAWVALVPLLAAILARWVMVETRGRPLVS